VNKPFEYYVGVSADWSSVEILSGSEVVGSVTDTSSAIGKSFANDVTVPVTLTQFGSNTLSIKVTNYAGVCAILDDATSIIYDPTPAAPAVSLFDDTSGGARITSDDALVGTAMPGSTVGDGYGSASAGADGTFPLKSSIPDGAHTLSVTTPTFTAQSARRRRSSSRSTPRRRRRRRPISPTAAPTRTSAARRW
jgi:hypothetical protein